MSVRVNRMMQKVRFSKEAQVPTAIRAPGLRFTSDNPTGKDKNEFELSLTEAQVLLTRVSAKYLGQPFKKVVELSSAEEMLPGDELVT